MTTEHRYVVGIDLGTTNSAVSYAEIQSQTSEKKANPPIRTFHVPQLTGPGEVTKQPILPSFLYLPGEYEISKESLALPWPTSNDRISGAFARDHGAKVPARLVSSAKSWLCHDRVDRRAKILPWGSKESVGKVSPVQAATAYLTHIRRAWNHAHGNDPELVLENQAVILTVPASFDEVARDLTLEAADQAGLAGVTLIEEPLAAFYSWLIRNEKEWRRHVNPGELILVCDVGGGTTDFTLITLRETEGTPRFERLAVGDHLILGGDNMDLALARRIESVFTEKNITLTGDRYKMLCHQCRQAKEAILGGKRDTAAITLMGEGSRLIAGTVRTELARSDVEETVLEGFFPLVTNNGERRGVERKGIGEFGLPYETEPAITRHLGEFLHRHREDAKVFTGRDSASPDLILFNGGALKSPLIQERIREAVRHWFGITDTTVPRILKNPNQDLAVSLGAAYYGLVKTGLGVRVGSGSARSYYLGISRSSAEEDAGTEAVCLVERGLDEGSDIELKDLDLRVLANQPVRFDVFSSSYRSGDRCGNILPVDESFTRLPPVQTVIEFGRKGKQSTIPVRLEARYTEMGTLSLWCRSQTTDHRWQLQFQLRDANEVVEVSDEMVLEEGEVSEVRDVVRSAFSDKSDPQATTTLVKRITGLLDRKKEAWPLTLIRLISDDLLELSERRKATQDLESRWMNLLGFCLRPGRGDGFDARRVKALWKIYKPGPIHTKNPQVRSEWWIMWRRVAAGMGPGHQRQISQDLSAILITGKGKKKRIPAQEQLEIWMLIANLEQLLAKDKIRWGKQLLSEIGTPTASPRLLWSISRIGARELLYGPTDRVIDPEEAFRWCKKLMGISWRTPKHILPAISSMARKTGDRIRDLTRPQYNEILKWMSTFKEAAPYMKPLEEVVPFAVEEENQLFGESLPSGLMLHD